MKTGFPFFIYIFNSFLQVDFDWFRFEMKPVRFDLIFIFYFQSEYLFLSRSYENTYLNAFL